MRKEINSFFICLSLYPCRAQLLLLLHFGFYTKQKEKREQSTSLTSSEVLGKPIRIKRVNAHAERRELSTSVLYGFV